MGSGGGGRLGFGGVRGPPNLINAQIDLKHSEIKIDTNLRQNNKNVTAQLIVS